MLSRTDPLAYFITFRTYGTWLHGDERGSTDRYANGFGAPQLAPNAVRESWARRKMRAQPVALDDQRRRLVAAALVEACERRAWVLMALAVQSNHVHVVVAAPVEPELAMRALNPNPPTRRGWRGPETKNQVPF
jgi:hypothetical protein